jgi:NitT/TauT family transport system ATP-binding protein
MEIKNLDFSFGKTNLFKNLSLKIENQKLTVFLGPSGCGKSTLLRIFAGLLKTEPSFIQNSFKASFVFQEANLLNWRTSEENIMLPFLLSKEKPPLKWIQDLTQKLKITECLQKYPHELSGGQKMRVSIARALATQPPILYLDEPFSALDEPTRMILQDELLELQKELQMTILFVTHSFFEAVYLADRILIFSATSPTAVVQDLSIQKNFLSRFDDSYQKQVRQVSSLFESSKLK